MAHDPTTTAILLVDPYNDFLARRGQAWMMTRDVALANGMIGKARSILEAARRLRMTVAYAPHHRWRPNGLKGRKYLHPTQFMQEKSHIFAAGKFGGEFLPELAPADGDIISSEHCCSSGFAGTDLHAQLQGRGITHLVIIGMITNSCIEATARSAVDLGYHVTLVTDAVAAFSPVEHDLAIRENYPRIGHAVTDASSLLETLRS
ncbi:isochorismatase family cysteine hydrolase [Methylobacterium haplocladii]|uniref:Isochorismatase n=1 Tax=Methylobacterium haplocladii TaxID=1176176 RepID=A0A512ISW6_9HYPH|nr:isochorismatase family cysteine hydrolase [Methylobacterium haplocladii]GEP00729.1 isochorismatase [Methylobacterium haplocladii]GJD82422.1 Peroxyureidoacrylate/ureidoacrylate amidohydrolase RutB [Methylobacterium haplocladii]GLS59544.1 isochorismatase [Methylobacterium haplocladii]